LIPAFARRLHDLSFRIGEVSLSFGIWYRFRRINLRGQLAFRFTKARFSDCLITSLLYQRGFGFTNSLQTRFSATQFIRQFIAS
jgi:hypothetical protein